MGRGGKIGEAGSRYAGTTGRSLASSRRGGPYGGDSTEGDKACSGDLGVDAGPRHKVSPGFTLLVPVLLTSSTPTTPTLSGRPPHLSHRQPSAQCPAPHPRVATGPSGPSRRVSSVRPAFPPPRASLGKTGESTQNSTAQTAPLPHPPVSHLLRGRCLEPRQMMDQD